MIKMISSKRFIGELIDDMDIITSDYTHRFYAWIEYALGMMNMANYYDLKSTIIEVENNTAKLPCDIKFFHSLWSQGTQPCGGYGLGYVTVTNNPLIGKEFKGFARSRDRVSMDDKNIYTDEKKARFLLMYRSIPKDAEGYPMIPDNPFVFEALNFYMIYRLAMRGVEHPLIKFKDAYNLWLDTYPRASNDVNWMTPAEYQDFTDFWNSPYQGNMVKNLYK